VLDEKDFVELIAGQLVGERGNAFANDCARKRRFCLPGNLLRRREGLEADLVPLGVALLGDEENFHDLEHPRFVAQLLD